VQTAPTGSEPVASASAEPVPGQPEDIGPFTADDLNTIKLATGILSPLQVQHPEEALGELREKMAQVAQEFADGKINQAQFQAIYTRYREQRAIIERLLAKDPTSDVWRQVVSEGHTGFLRAQYESRVIGYALFDNESSVVIKAHGQFNLDPDLLVPMLNSFRHATSEIFGAGMQSTQIEGGRWLVFVPGQFTTAIVIFSLEPAAEQLKTLTELHRDFETANQRALVEGDLNPDLLVYPQRTLFPDE
jgi:hypothetical protein